MTPNKAEDSLAAQDTFDESQYRQNTASSLEILLRRSSRSQEERVHKDIPGTCPLYLFGQKLYEAGSVPRMRKLRCGVPQIRIDWLNHAANGSARKRITRRLQDKYERVDTEEGEGR